MKFRYYLNDTYTTIEADSPAEVKDILRFRIEAVRRELAAHQNSLTYWLNFLEDLNERYK